jgi:hypothetical protein
MRRNLTLRRNAAYQSLEKPRHHTAERRSRPHDETLPQLSSMAWDKQGHPSPVGRVPTSGGPSLRIDLSLVCRPGRIAALLSHRQQQPAGVNGRVGRSDSIASGAEAVDSHIGGRGCRAVGA